MTLALFGGPTTVTAPKPHNRLAALRDADRTALAAFLSNPDADFDDVSVLHELETSLAAFHGRRYCLLTNSGTSALHSAYFGLGIGPGDEVIAPTHTYPATVTALLAVGATPVLADSEPDTGNIDPDDIARRITPRTKAIAVTHQWGHPVEADSLIALAQRHGLRLVEDVSLAVGATYRGRRTGSFGDAAALSLSAGKLISGGLGGALLTDDRDVIDRALLLGQFSRSSELAGDAVRHYADSGFGHNYRIHVLAAVVVKSRLGDLAELIARRHSRLDMLTHLLGEQEIVLPPVTRPYVHRGQWGGYVARYNSERAAGVPLPVFSKALSAEGLMVSPGGYHPLLHRTAHFARKPPAGGSRYREGDFPQAERHQDASLGMPTFLDEPDELIEGYAAAVVKVVRHLNQLR